MNDADLILTGVVIDENWCVGFYELCHTCHADEKMVVEMVEYGLLEPEGTATDNWKFNAYDLRRLQRTLRLQHDLEINLHGVALVLDLMDEIEQLRAKLKRVDYD